MVSNDDFDGKATHLNCFYLHINFEQKYSKPAIVCCRHNIHLLSQSVCHWGYSTAVSYTPLNCYCLLHYCSFFPCAQRATPTPYPTMTKKYQLFLPSKYDSDTFDVYVNTLKEKIANAENIINGILNNFSLTP